ncbi:ArsC/Spx/MgsR family protein [Sulfitobacter geojensis]|uniref:ArsC/Spx/MgsR family protein n=1 Tax=Sulfitobacter geojensis TaxID=1342299 RepID=UPI0007D8FC9D|nr:ArsC/Spx/MgsR family protein [Sulfitobacter geojensis]OAN96731.1 arsenate reductase [Sulfitobacter geojensis]
MILYGLKNCDTCRKALKSLPQAELRDVRKDGVPEDVLAAALEKFGDALLNTRSTTWRGLDEAQRQAAPMDLLKAHPALMKRPLIDVNNTLFLGWNNAVEADIKASL